MAEFYLLAGLLVSIRRPQQWIWPPPEQRSWQFLSVWMATAVAFLASIPLAFLDYGTFLFDHVGIEYAAGLVHSDFAQIFIVWLKLPTPSINFFALWEMGSGSFHMFDALPVGKL